MSSGHTILVIDDEPQIRRVVHNALAGETARVLEADSAKSGLDLAASAQPALIVLDLGLLDADGLEVCRDLRAFSHAPIIVLSARYTDRDKAELLDAGADDYLTKPFSTLELQARVRALLRRARTAVDEPSETITAGPIEIDFVRRTVHRDGAEVHLTPTEWSLLRALATHRGRTMTHRQLFNAVWSRSEGDAQQYLRVYVGMVESITDFLDAYVKQTTPIASAELEARLSSSAPHWISARGVPVRARLIPRTGAASRTRR